MNEHRVGYQIQNILNQDLRLPSHAVEQLRAARERALERQKTSGLANVNRGGGAGILGGIPAFHSLLPKVVLPLVILVIGLLAINTWQQTQTVQEIEEIDAAVLTGELPIDAYLDKGFDAWLKRSSQ